MKAVAQPWTRTGVACLLLLLALSAGLRFHALAAQGLWSDELFSASIVTQVGQGQAWYHYVPKVFPDLRIGDSALTWKAGENSPPLFEALLWLWTRVFGESDFAMRSLSAVAGTLAPVVLFAGLRRPLGGVAAGVAGLLMALSPAAVSYAQEVRGYALLMLLASAAVVRLVRFALVPREAGVPGPRFGWDVLLYLLLAWTHYTGLVLACALVATRFAIALARGWPLREFFWFVLVPLLLAPWLYLNWFSMAATSTGRFGWRDYGWTDVRSLMLPKAMAFFIPGAWAGWGVLALAALGAGLGRERRGGRTVAWLLAAFAGMIVLHFAYGIYTAFHARVWHERYFSAMLPVGVVLLTLLFSRATGRARALGWGAVALALAASAMALPAQYHKPWKEGYREASAWIASHAAAHTTVVATWAPNAIYFNYYLRGDMAHEGKTYDLLTVGAEGDLPQGVAALCAKAWKPGEQMVLFQHQMHRLYHDMLRERCPGVFRQVAEKRFDGLYVDFYEASPP